MTAVDRIPAARDVRVFGLLWLLFFGAVAALSWWKPQAMLAAATLMIVAWSISMLFHAADRRRQLLGLALPSVLALAGGARRLGIDPFVVVAVASAVALLGAIAIWAHRGLGTRVYRVWMQAAEPVGWTVTRIVLGLVYYGVLTPVGLALRLAGKDPMNRSFDREAATYWIRRETSEKPSRSFRQF